MHEIETDKNKCTYVDPTAGRIPFRQFAASWLDGRTFDESTREAVDLWLRLHVFPHFGDTELRAILPSTIQAWDRALQRKGLAETYRRTIFANVSSSFTAAVDDERIRKNSCNGRSVIKPRGAYPTIVPWGRDRVVAVRAALGERYRMGVDLGAGCGLRQGEVFGLSCDDIDETEGVVHVLRQVKIVGSRMVFGPPKHGKSRVVPLSSTVAASIRTHLAAFPPLDVTLPWQHPNGDPVTVPLLLWTRERGPIYRHSFNHHAWKLALRVAGVPDPGRADGFHALRHFYASILLDQGVSIRALADYLGMRTRRSPSASTHLLPTNNQRARDAIDRIALKPPRNEPCDSSFADGIQPYGCEVLL